MATCNHERPKVRACKLTGARRTTTIMPKPVDKVKKSAPTLIGAARGVFILISFVLLVNSYIDHQTHQERHQNHDHQQQQQQQQAGLFRVMRADAGSKSKDKSSKTTVIAISGGQAAKPQPVPVPWPVIHCHHHHHHLKYVPKPVLVHHWVKKQKAPIEIHESSNEHYQVMDSRGASLLADQPAAHAHAHAHAATSMAAPHGQHQVSFFGDAGLAPLGQPSNFAMPPSNNNNNHLLPKVPFPDLMDGSQLVSALSNEFDISGGGGLAGSAPMSASGTNLFGNSLEMAPLDLNKFQATNTFGANFSATAPKSAHFSDKQLEKLTKSILTAQQKGAQGNKRQHATPGHNKPPRDTDSGLDSLKSNVVAAATGSSSHDTGDINGTYYGLDGYDFSSPHDHSAASNQTTAHARGLEDTRAHFSGKPSHPFDDLQDQLKDESSVMAAAVTRAPPTLDLTSANLKEESDSRQAYQRLALESARQLNALNEAYRQRALASLMMAGPQPIASPLVPAPQVGQQVVTMAAHASGNHLFGSQAANQRTLSESHAIGLMTHLAERMAQLEANNLVERHRMAAAAAVANNSAPTSHGPMKSSSATAGNNLFGGFLGNLNLFARAPPARLRATSHKDTRRRHSSGPAQIIVGTQSAATSKNAPTNYQRFLAWQSATSSSTTTQAPRPAHRDQPSGLAGRDENNDYIITASPLYINLVAPGSDANYRAQQASLRHNQAASPQLLAYGQRHPTPGDQQQERLLSESSSQVNNIAQPSFVRPPQGFSTSVAQQPKRIIGAAPTASRPPPPPAPPTGQSQQQSQQPKSQTNSIRAGTITATPASVTPTTTPQMSPDQESNFYTGQREHLASEAVEASSTSSSLTPPSPSADQTAPAQQASSGAPLPAASSSALGHAYTPQPSNVVGRAVAAAPAAGDMQYQQQQQQQTFAPTPEQLQPFLQFPMSPAQWSSEALRSLNAVHQQQQQAASDQVTSAAGEEPSNEQAEGQDSSSSSSGQDASSGSEQQDKTLALDPNDGQAHTYYLDANGNLESATGGDQQQQQTQSQNQHELSQFEQMLLLHNPQQQQQQAMMMAGSGGPQMSTPWHIGSHGGQFQTPSSFVGPNWAQTASEPASLAMQQSAQQAYGYYTTGAPLDASWPPPGGTSVSPYDARMQQHFLAQSFPTMAQASPAAQFASAPAREHRMVAPPGGGMDQFVASSLASPMSELDQWRQFQGRLSGGGGVVGAQAGGNFSGLAGSLGGLLPNQMQSRFPLAGQAGAGLPQMPQIPNIPQPPQMPNLPMPPPGMMQMAASVALPLAMARATRQQNRFRNNQVNSAASQGGATTAGQRFLRGASNLTNRFMRTRRRPSSTSSPALAMGSRPTSSAFNRQRRRRPSLLASLNTNRVSSMLGQPGSTRPHSSSAAHRPHRHSQPMGVRFLQTVVDMSRRPPVVAVASNLAASATAGVLSAATKATAAAATASAAAAVAASPARGEGASNAARVAAASKVISSVASAASQQVAAAASGPVDKLKPKIDHMDELQEVLASPERARITRSGAHTSRGGSSPSGVVFAGLPPVALTDGTLHRFESMTSPVDLMNRQLRRARELEWQRQHQTQRASVARNALEHAHRHKAHLHQPHLELLRLSSRRHVVPTPNQVVRPTTPMSTPGQTSAHYQLVTAAPTSQFTQFETSTINAVAPEEVDSSEHTAATLAPDLTPTPVNATSTYHAPQVVTNHFNLLMFTNKNVTGNLLAPGLSEAPASAGENEQAVAMPQPPEPEPVVDEVANVAAGGQGEPEQQVAAYNPETSIRDDQDEQRRQYEAMQQAHDANRVEQPTDERPRAQEVRESTASNAIDSSAAPQSNKHAPQAPGGMILIKMTPSEGSGGASESTENRRTVEASNSGTRAQVVARAPVVEEKSTRAPRRRMKKKSKSSEADAGGKLTTVTTTQSPTTTTSTTAAPSTVGSFKNTSDDYATAGSQWTEIRASPASTADDQATSVRVKKMSHLKTLLTKRSTSARPAGPSILIGTAISKPSDSPTPSRSFETVGEKTPPEVTELTAAGDESTSAPRVAQAAQAQTSDSDQSAADYVRAIKLVRGVAYPWPPPTQSSKTLASSTSDRQTLDAETETLSF